MPPTEIPDEIVFYVVTASPRDYPGQFVLRRHVVTPEGQKAERVPMAVSSDLSVVRAKVPAGWTKLDPDPADDKVILEWYADMNQAPRVTVEDRSVRMNACAQGFNWCGPTSGRGFCSEACRIADHMRGFTITFTPLPPSESSSIDELKAAIITTAQTGADAAARIEADLKGEITRLEAMVADLQSGMFINCVYCGHRYGPREATAAVIPGAPATMAEALAAHVAACPKHPMSALRERLSKANKLLERASASLHEADDLIQDVSDLETEDEGFAPLRMEINVYLDEAAK